MREQPNVFLSGSLNTVNTEEVSQVGKGIGQNIIMESHDWKPGKANQDSADDNKERWL